MSLPIVFRAAAQTEFKAASAWYELQQPGLGADFVSEVERVLDVIQVEPKLFPFAESDLARSKGMEITNLI